MLHGGERESEKRKKDGQIIMDGCMEKEVEERQEKDRKNMHKK